MILWIDLVNFLNKTKENDSLGVSSSCAAATERPSKFRCTMREISAQLRFLAMLTANGHQNFEVVEDPILEKEPLCWLATKSTEKGHSKEIEEAAFGDSFLPKNSTEKGQYQAMEDVWIRDA